MHIDADAARTRVVRVPLPRITDAERNEIDLAESLGPAARLDQAKQEFKSLKEKAEHYVTADGRKIGGDQVERGDFFTFLNKLLKHELKRASESLAPAAPPGRRRRGCCVCEETAIAVGAFQEWQEWVFLPRHGCQEWQEWQERAFLTGMAGRHSWQEWRAGRRNDAPAGMQMPPCHVFPCPQ